MRIGKSLSVIMCPSQINACLFLQISWIRTRLILNSQSNVWTCGPNLSSIKWTNWLFSLKKIVFKVAATCAVWSHNFPIKCNLNMLDIIFCIKYGKNFPVWKLKPTLKFLKTAFFSIMWLYVGLWENKSISHFGPITNKIEDKPWYAVGRVCVDSYRAL